MEIINNKNTIKILVVDDQPITRELLYRAVSAPGFAVDSASNGEDALAKWQEQRYPLVITDCQMPIMNGYAFCRAVRELEQAENLNHTTVIAWSGDTGKEEQEKCLKAGMDDFLNKPINFDELNQLLSTFAQVTYSKNTNNDQLKNLTQGKQPPVDYTILSQIVPDPDQQKKMLNDLLIYIQNDYPAMQQYVRDQHLNDLSSAAHRLKGACQMVGANNIADVFATIEKNALEISMTEAGALLSKIKETTKQLESHITSNQITQEIERQQ